MGKHTRHGVPIDYVPDRAGHRRALHRVRTDVQPVRLDGRDHADFARANLEAEYRGLGIDPALIDIIESGVDPEALLPERTAHAKATGYLMRDGKSWAPCVVDPIELEHWTASNAEDDALDEQAQEAGERLDERQRAIARASRKVEASDDHGLIL
jgi:hypothetical protein